jgi:hypothetical protein
VDPADPSLEFIEKKDNLRPLAIFRVDTEFLLCYDGRLNALHIRLYSDYLQNGRSLSINMASGHVEIGKQTGKADQQRSVCAFT